MIDIIDNNGDFELQLGNTTFTTSTTPDEGKISIDNNTLAIISFLGSLENKIEHMRISNIQGRNR